MLANTLLAGPGLVDQLGPGLQELQGPGQPVAERGKELLGPAGGRTKPDPDEGKTQRLYVYGPAETSVHTFMDKRKKKKPMP